MRRKSLSARRTLDTLNSHATNLLTGLMKLWARHLKTAEDLSFYE